MGQEIKNMSKMVKKYFAMDGAAASWWDPENKKLAEFIFYENQPRIITENLDISNKNVLDVTTGKGRFAIHFAKNGAKNVVAVDISMEMLEIAKKRAIENKVKEKIDFSLSDVEALCFHNESFDVVTCMEGFVHFPNPQKTMTELARVTKTGGIVIANTDVPLTNTSYYSVIYSHKSLGEKIAMIIKTVLSKINHLFCRSIYDFPKERNSSKLLTTEQTILVLQDNPNLILTRAEDAINRISKREFIKFFRHASLSIVHIVREGYWYCPKGYIIFAKKI